MDAFFGGPWLIWPYERMEMGWDLVATFLTMSETVPPTSSFIKSQKSIMFFISAALGEGCALVQPWPFHLKGIVKNLVVKLAANIWDLPMELFAQGFPDMPAYSKIFHRHRSLGETRRHGGSFLIKRRYSVLCHFFQSKSHFSVLEIKWISLTQVPSYLHSIMCPGEPWSSYSSFVHCSWYQWSSVKCCLMLRVFSTNGSVKNKLVSIKSSLFQ